MGGSKTEDFLGDHLEKEGLKVARGIEIGRYELDLLVEDVVIVEIDGYHHLQRDRISLDRRKDRYLRGLGYEVLRVEAGKVADIEERNTLTREIAKLLKARNKINRRRDSPNLTTDQLALLESIREAQPHDPEGESTPRPSAAESPEDEKDDQEDPRDTMLRYLDENFPEK